MPVSKDGKGKGEAKSRWGAGVTPYKEMGYWRPDYEPEDSDILAAFRITPQPGVDPEEAAVETPGYPTRSSRAYRAFDRHRVY